MKIVIALLLGMFSISAMAQQDNSHMPPIKKDDGTQKTVNNLASQTQRRPPVKTGAPGSSAAKVNGASANGQANKAPIRRQDTPAPGQKTSGTAKQFVQQKPTASSVSIKQTQAAQKAPVQAPPPAGKQNPVPPANQ